MADDWDDWGDDDNKSAKGSDKSEGWDWPAAEGGASEGSALVAKQEQRQHDPSPDFEDVEERNAAVDEMTGKYFLELQKYLEDLADPSVREEINQELTARDFSSLAQYYDGRDDLVAYTLDTELRRMKYSIVAEDGRRIGGAAFAPGAERGQGEQGVGDVSSVAGGTAIRDFLSGRRDSDMLRMANQSIFADMLQAIQGRLLRPDLEISVISRDCEFSLDFSKGVLEAHSLFEVSTVGNGGAGAPETLEIAQIKGTVCVDTENQVCSQRLLSPQLRMVFDDAMRASARVLALHSLMDGGMSGSGTGPGAGKGSSLDRMGLLRTSLARASSDGMGRAAAAGTGLLANVVAGVGSAIGATRSGTEGEYFAGGSGGSGGGGGTGGRGDGAAPLVQLYRRTDDDEPLSRAGIASNAATTHANFSTSCSSSTDTGAGAVTTGNSATGVSSAAPGNSGSWEVGDRIEGTVESAGAAGEDGGMERRSALGVASATGGAVLRGLWGGIQSAAAAGVAVAARQGGSGGDGVSGGGDVRPPSEFKLCRRERDT